MIAEDESRVIGNIHIPESLWQKKEQGIFIEIEGTRSLPKNTLTCFQKHLRSMQFYTGISFFGDDDMKEWGELVNYVNDKITYVA